MWSEDRPDAAAEAHSAGRHGSDLPPNWASLVSPVTREQQSDYCAMHRPLAPGGADATPLAGAATCRPYVPGLGHPAPVKQAISSVKENEQ